MTNPKMKPCPKCGEDVEVYTYDPPSSSRRVECDGCGYTASCEGSVLQAIRSHNERAANPPQSHPTSRIAGS